MEKLSRNATDEGAKSYHNCVWRTLIRRLRRLPSRFAHNKPSVCAYHREGLRSNCEHPDKSKFNAFRSVEFSGLVAPENCREYGFGYGVVYLTKNDMATLKSGFIFITPQ